MQAGTLGRPRSEAHRCVARFGGLLLDPSQGGHHGRARPTRNRSTAALEAILGRGWRAGIPATAGQKKRSAGRIDATPNGLRRRSSIGFSNDSSSYRRSEGERGGVHSGFGLAARRPRDPSTLDPAADGQARLPLGRRSREDEPRIVVDRARVDLKVVACRVGVDAVRGLGAASGRPDAAIAGALHGIGHFEKAAVVAGACASSDAGVQSVQIGWRLHPTNRGQHGSGDHSKPS